MHQAVSHEPGVLRGGSALRREMMDCRRCDTEAIDEFCFVAIGWCICCAWGVYATLSWECKAAGESDGRERLLPGGRLWLQKRQESMNDGDGGSGD